MNSSAWVQSQWRLPRKERLVVFSCLCKFCNCFINYGNHVPKKRSECIINTVNVIFLIPATTCSPNEVSWNVGIMNTCPDPNFIFITGGWMFSLHLADFPNFSCGSFIINSLGFRLIVFKTIYSFSSSQLHCLLGLWINLCNYSLIHCTFCCWCIKVK